MKLTEVTKDEYDSFAENKKIVLVSGNLCSGKGHFCKNAYPDYEHIVVSDIVRSLMQSSDRSKLQDSKHLDERIAAILSDLIYPHEKVVVDGIRQVSIIDALKQRWGDKIEDIIWLDVPTDVLRSRFDNRASAKDNISFDDAMARDEQLGIRDVENYIRTNHRVVSN